VAADNIVTLLLQTGCYVTIVCADCS